MNEDIKKEIREILLTKTGNVNVAIIRKNSFLNGELFKRIKSATSQFNKTDLSISNRIKLILNDKIEYPKCPICQTLITKISPFKNKIFPTYCPNCIGKYKRNNKILNQFKITRKNNKLSLYQSFYDEFNKFNFEMIDDYNLYKKVKQYINKKSNFNQWVNSKNIVENKILLYNILNKTKNLLPIIKDKYKWSERFYLIYHKLSSLPICPVCNKNLRPYINFIAGYQKTCNLKCGYNIGSKHRIINHFEKIKNLITDNIKDEFELITNSDKFNGLNNERIKFKHKKCGYIFDCDLSDGKWQKTIHCPICKLNGISFEQREVMKFIQEIYNKEIIESFIIPKTEYKNSIGKEIDIYLPDKKLGFEYDGIFWHSKINKFAHLQKTESCEKLGIHLCHIFSNEWTNPIKKSIWKSIIKFKLGLIQNKINGKDCIIKEIDNNSKISFMLTNHLHGNDISNIRLGLFNNNTLISCMTFIKPGFNNNYQWELSRFCTIKDTIVIGAAEKLLDYFQNNYNNLKLPIVSYADRRWSNGNLYKQLGFNLINSTAPNYFWIKGYNKVFSRYQTQKHNLKNILGENFNPELSEDENMHNNKFCKIYDCGNLVYIWTKK